MFLIKLFILLIVFGVSLVIGNLMAKKYSNRVKELREMKNALNMVETKIKFTYEPIPQIFEEISKQVSFNVSEIFKNAKIYMNDMSAGQAWSKAVFETQTNFVKEDKEVLQGLGRMLGKTDADGQISEIQLVSNFLDNQIENADEEKRKNEKMYKSLGGVVGLTIVIILI